MSDFDAFLENKTKFFNNSYDISGDKTDKKILNQIQQGAKETSYDFLLKHIDSLEIEFETLFNTLQQNPQNRRKFWLYAYYLSEQVAEFYKAYGPKDKAESSEQMASQIRGYLQNGEITVQEVSKINPTFLERLYNHIKQWFQDLRNRISKAVHAKNTLADINLVRMMYMVSRLTLLNFVLILNNAHLIERLGKLLNQQLSLDVLQQRLGSLQGVANVLSVGLFAGRAAINTILSIKHIFFPSEKEKNAAWNERFMFELKKLHGQYLNDIAWSLVNLFTNYPQILGLSFPAVIGITVGFLAFDLTLILWLWHQDEKKYKIKKDQLQSQLQSKIDELKKDPSIPDSTRVEHLKVLLDQMAFLEINHKSTNAAYHMNAVAAVFLFASFATAFAMATPLGSVACLGVAVIAVAFYRSSGQYSDMVRKREMLNKVKKDGGDVQAAEKAYKQAKWEFAKSMLKYTIMPTIILTTFILCWPAALVEIAIFAVYEIVAGMQKASAQKSEHDILLPLTAAQKDEKEDNSNSNSNKPSLFKKEEPKSKANVDKKATDHAQKNDDEPTKEEPLIDAYAIPI